MMKTDLSFHCVAVPRCIEKRLCAGFDNCPSRNNAAPVPTDEELFAAYWKDQERTNFYAHSPAQIAQGLRNVYMLALAHKLSAAQFNGTINVDSDCVINGIAVKAGTSLKLFATLTRSTDRRE